MIGPPQDQIEALVSLYYSGQMTKTEQACVEFLRSYPQSLIVFNILGAALQGQGKLREAVNIYDKAIQLKPDYAVAYCNRGNALRDLGQVEEAVKSYDMAIRLKPDFAVAYSNRGAALKDLGRVEAALESYGKAIQFKPEYADAYNNRGVALKDLGRVEEAVQSHDKAIRIKPDFADAYYNRGNALRDLRQSEAALESYDKAIRLKPEYADAYNNRGVVLKDLGRVEEALESYDKAIRLKPDSADVFNNRGVALRDLGRVEAALESYEKAIQLKPDYADAYNNGGVALEDLGRVEEAVKSYEKAIQLRPNYAVAYSNLCEFYEKHNRIAELEKTVHRAQGVLPENDPNLLYRMAQLASRERRPEDARGFLERIDPEDLSLRLRGGCTGLLAMTYDKLGQFDKAFTQFEITNSIVKQSSEAKKFNAQRYFNRVAELSKSWLGAEKTNWPVVQLPNQRSLAFLVGFPRSGTTLLDTILMSHAEVAVVEEQPMVRAMRDLTGGPATPDRLSRLSDGKLAELRKAYYDELSTHIDIDGSYQIIIDKHPLNTIQAALIHRVFPDAKFILALRHPCDCILSCFMQNFKLNDATSNFLSLEQTARLYDAVMSLWSSYDNALDLDVDVVKYEKLILDLQGTVEPLLNFLDLDWHDDLLDYRHTALSRGKINTASYNQVTQKLYTQASGRWKNYRDQMKEILPLLEPWEERFGYPVESS